jgi:Ca2+-binding RTX toxin-like protein
VTGTDIVVPSTSTGDIVGGSVISLAKARKLYRSACLNGSGPEYVVVGTRMADTITVRNARLRVLGLGGADHIDVISGRATCVDGGTGNDIITDTSVEKDSLYGGAGSDHITVSKGPAFASGGNGNDVLKAANKAVVFRGNSGADRITTGNGNDNVSGGNGSDTIFVGTGVDRVNGGAGNNTITAEGKRAFVVAGSGNTTAYLQKSNTVFAKRHGVKQVNLLSI